MPRDARINSKQHKKDKASQDKEHFDMIWKLTMIMMVMVLISSYFVSAAESSYNWVRPSESNITQIVVNMTNNLDNLTVNTNAHLPINTTIGDATTYLRFDMIPDFGGFGSINIIHAIATGWLTKIIGYAYTIAIMGDTSRKAEIIMLDSDSGNLATIRWDNTANTLDIDRDLVLSADMTADYFIGDGSLLTNLPQQYNNPFNQSLNTTDSPTYNNIAITGELQGAREMLMFSKGTQNTDAYLKIGEAPMTVYVGALMMRDGSITGYSIHAQDSTHTTTGNVSFNIQINGTNVIMRSINFTATGIRNFTMIFPRNQYTFKSGSYINILSDFQQYIGTLSGTHALVEIVVDT